MVVSIDQAQQERVYKYYHIHFHPGWEGIKQPQMNETTRRQEINENLDELHKYVNKNDLTALQLQVAMIDYLVIREHQEALHLPPTCVSDILRFHFQNISHRDLQKVVKRLVVFCSPADPVNPPQPSPAPAPGTPSDRASQEALYEVLIDSYEAVRAGHIKSPKIIRDIALRFFEIEDDPEANKNFPYDAGKSARILLRQAKWYEDHGR